MPFVKPMKIKFVSVEPTLLVQLPVTPTGSETPSEAKTVT
jgi:hypothetical protein